MKQGGMEIYHCSESACFVSDFYKFCDLEAADKLWTGDRFTMGRSENSIHGRDDQDFWRWDLPDEAYWMWAFDNLDIFYADQGYTFNSSSNPNSNWYENSNVTHYWEWYQSILSGININSIHFIYTDGSGTPAYQLQIVITDPSIPQEDNKKTTAKSLKLICSGPNPTDNKWFIRFKNNIKETIKARVIFYNIVGSKICETKNIYIKPNQDKIRLNLKNYFKNKSKGVYFYKLIYKNKFLYGKLTYIE